MYVFDSAVSTLLLIVIPVSEIFYEKSQWFTDGDQCQTDSASAGCVFLWAAMHSRYSKTHAENQEQTYPTDSKENILI